jgi:hypothetical protein
VQVVRTDEVILVVVCEAEMVASIREFATLNIFHAALSVLSGRMNVIFDITQFSIPTESPGATEMPFVVGLDGIHASPSTTPPRKFANEAIPPFRRDVRPRRMELSHAFS